MITGTLHISIRSRCRCKCIVDHLIRYDPFPLVLFSCLPCLARFCTSKLVLYASGICTHRFLLKLLLCVLKSWSCVFMHFLNAVMEEVSQKEDAPAQRGWSWSSMHLAPLDRSYYTSNFAGSFPYTLQSLLASLALSTRLPHRVDASSSLVEDGVWLEHASSYI